MKTLVIYHANCTDGFGAAWAASRKFGSDADYVACDYGRRPPAITSGQDVYIVDFSFPRDMLLEIGETAKTVTVLDHHKTARDALVGPWPPNMDVNFDMDRSGARMAWEHFHDDPAPAIILHIEDRDLWQFKMDGTRELHAAINSYPFSFSMFDTLLIDAMVECFKIEGRAIIRFIDQKVADLVAVKQYMTIAGHDVPVVNAPAWLASEVGNKLGVGEPFAATWCASTDEIYWSLRSAPDGLDVGLIAKQFGGGGHLHAAGYKTSRGS